MNPPELTETPSFSAAEVAPRDPLSLSVSVNEYTTRVSLDVRSVDRQSAPSVPSRDTDGAETIVFPISTAGLPPGLYLARYIGLSDEIRPDTSFYSTWNPDGTYRLGAQFGPEGSRQCPTDIPVASFTVVASD